MIPYGKTSFWKFPRVKTFDNLTEAELDVTFAFLPDGEGMAGLLGVFFLVHSPRGVV